MANIVLVDDHVLLRTGLAGLVRNLGHTVLFEASNGNDFMNQLQPESPPDVVLMDINMPEKDGYETTLWLKINYPEIKVLALSMYDNENAIIRMLKNGARGYILKDSDPIELQEGIDALLDKGYYYSELVSGKLINALNNRDNGGAAPAMILSERESSFLQYTCSELTYKEIAEKMFLSPRTVDGYRDALFVKLGVKTRVGLVVFAIRNGLVDLS